MYCHSVFLQHSINVLVLLLFLLSLYLDLCHHIGQPSLVHPLDMVDHVGPACVSQVAERALVRPDSLVQHFMVFQAFLLCKLPTANRTLKEALSGAPPKADVETLLVAERPAAVRAHKGPVCIVYVHVLLEVVLVVGEVAADVALVLLTQLVDVPEVVVLGRGHHLGPAQVADEPSQLVLAHLVDGAGWSSD